MKLYDISAGKDVFCMFSKTVDVSMEFSFHADKVPIHYYPLNRWYINICISRNGSAHAEELDLDGVELVWDIGV